MIRFDNVSIRLNGFSLENLSFTIPTGKYAVLMGRTGSGKTTILEAICGLRPLAAGRIHVMDRDVTNLPPGKRKLGLVPQDAALFTTMNVEEQLGFALRIKKQPRDTVRRRTAELAELLGISHLLKRLPDGLSGGERRRVALGRALAAQPAVLLMDEPLAALDEKTHAALTELLERMHRETGVTVLHITHNSREARALAQQLMTLINGAVVTEQNGGEQ